MKGEHPVRMLCELLGVAPSGFYRVRKQGLGPRQREDAALAAQIAAAHEASRGTYGAPRIVEELREEGTRPSPTGTWFSPCRGSSESSSNETERCSTTSTTPPTSRSPPGSATAPAAPPANRALSSPSRRSVIFSSGTRACSAPTRCVARLNPAGLGRRSVAVSALLRSLAPDRRRRSVGRHPGDPPAARSRPAA
ncbi:MAG: IS3 family transposase [Verrucomicrobia bacterium]|nr:IS3 family transposase [Verrucomicrobiota bacterium]